MGECYSNDEKCCCPCHREQEETCGEEEGHDGFDNFFLEIADCAWTEVLKDKIKEYILQTQNDRMTKLAKIVAEGNNQRWRYKMEKKQICADFEEKLGNFFSQSKK